MGVIIPALSILLLGCPPRDLFRFVDEGKQRVRRHIKLLDDRCALTITAGSFIGRAHNSYRLFLNIEAKYPGLADSLMFYPENIQIMLADSPLRKQEFYIIGYANPRSFVVERGYRRMKLGFELHPYRESVVLNGSINDTVRIDLSRFISYKDSFVVVPNLLCIDGNIGYYTAPF